ncbi:MAG: hypothetical protein HYT12_00920 [Candidatus Liptonbacteria bacterium]|nr:hypothetical protein [Candidatus Liptonbacteria bacterium]
MKSSIKKRFRITKSGVAIRRLSGFNHFRAKKGSKSKQRGRKVVGLRAKIDFDS